MITAIVLGALAACTLLWCTRLVLEQVFWSRAERLAARRRLAVLAERAEAAKKEIAGVEAETSALAAKNDVMAAVLARLQAGQSVSDSDVPELVEQTGAPVATVFEALDALAGRAGTWGPGSQS
jgi:hypothetical protein